MVSKLDKSCPFTSSDHSCSWKWLSPLGVTTSPLLKGALCPWVCLFPPCSPFVHSSWLTSMTPADSAQPNMISPAFRLPEHSISTSCTTCVCLPSPRGKGTILFTTVDPIVQQRAGKEVTMTPEQPYPVLIPASGAFQTVVEPPMSDTEMLFLKLS